jgi:hypothetical protein
MMPVRIAMPVRGVVREQTASPFGSNETTGRGYEADLAIPRKPLPIVIN